MVNRRQEKRREEKRREEKIEEERGWRRKGDEGGEERSLYHSGVYSKARKNTEYGILLG